MAVVHLPPHEPLRSKSVSPLFHPAGRSLPGLVVLVAAAMQLPSVASAQHADKTFFTRRDAVATGIALAGTAVVFQFDDRIARWTQEPSVQGGSSRRRVVKDLTFINETPFTF